MADLVIPDLDDAILGDLQVRAMFTGRTPQEEARAILASMVRPAPDPFKQPWPGPRIPYTALPEAKPGEKLAQEWNTYRREVGRLLTEGHEGRYILIKDDTLVGIYDNWEAARAEGVKRYHAKPFLARPILAEEPLLRLRGYNLPCPS